MSGYARIELQTDEDPDSSYLNTLTDYASIKVDQGHLQLIKQIHYDKPMVEVPLHLLQAHESIACCHYDQHRYQFEICSINQCFLNYPVKIKLTEFLLCLNYAYVLIR